ncbi:hypothetical protein PHPALM_30439 [Phytophthora palmivora]|uniref:Uncharacterized protein n=1 Tax=Phytophthora palmivora TaxID=4796 RepID=A0A2P4X556_9STRA|nr:hypothetical protein PHPALM_30439 [Phytophthora palmivora]
MPTLTSRQNAQYSLSRISKRTHTVSVCIRMGQSFGKLKDRYIHFWEGADQHCGRMTAELPYNSERFGVLAPHFPPEMLTAWDYSYRDWYVTSLLSKLIFYEEKLLMYTSTLKIKKKFSEKLPNAVAVKVCNELRQHFVVNGVAPISSNDLDRKINEL